MGRPKLSGRAGLSGMFVVAVLALAAPASAEAQIAAGPPNQYLTPSVTIDQGEQVTFSNSDIAEHDVLARDKGPDGKPLFRSELTGLGGSVPVEGTEYLTTGSYEFLCSLHTQMVGTLNVSSAGTPKTRPPAAAALKLTILSTRVSRVKRADGLRVRITASRGATVKMTARAKDAVFAKGRAKVRAGKSKTVRLPLTRAGRRAVNGGAPIKVSVAAVAKGSDGETAKKSAKTKLR